MMLQVSRECVKVRYITLKRQMSVSAGHASVMASPPTVPPAPSTSQMLVYVFATYLCEINVIFKVEYHANEIH